MKILSVDWDYFFPDSEPYDWGNFEPTEDRVKLFMNNLVWRFRWSNVHCCGPYIGDKVAIDHYVPNKKIITNFFDKVVKGEPKKIVIADTHRDIVDLLKQFYSLNGKKIEEVVNFDAHHDYGYNQEVRLDCGNWAKLCKKLYSKYTLYYPKWRKENKEGNIGKMRFTPKYGLPRKAVEFDVIFVCRSGSWTPPWADDDFILFVSQLQRYKSGWENASLDYHLLNRREFIPEDVNTTNLIIKELRRSMEENGK